MEGQVQSILCHMDKLIITQELEMLYALNFNISEIDFHLYISRASDSIRQSLEYFKRLYR